MTATDDHLLVEIATTWGLSLSPQQFAQFQRYLDELIIWNERFNLTAVRERPAIIRRHLLDSLWLARHWGEAPTSLIDIGSGAGFPGLPLKILRPDLRVTLVEAIGKKADFLRHVINTLDLSGVTVYNERIEVIGHRPGERGQYDLATARAVAELRVLVEYALPLLRVGGLLLAQKGRDPRDEIAAARQALTILGGEVRDWHPVTIPDEESRSLVIVTKVCPTPERYPRAVGVPARRPLGAK